MINEERNLKMFKYCDEFCLFDVFVYYNFSGLFPNQTKNH